MSEKPIIFSAPMVRSILSGTKTQTRRIIKPKPWNKNGDTVDIGIASGAHYVKGSDGRMYFQFDHPRGGPLTAHVAPYAVGDVLWVREACRADEDMADQKYVEYLADSSRRLLDLAPDDNCSDAFSDWWNLMAYRSNDPGLDGSKPVPSIHMPRWASRITLKVTGVKVERLNDISEDDAVAGVVTVRDTPVAYVVGDVMVVGRVQVIGADRPEVGGVEEHADRRTEGEYAGGDERQAQGNVTGFG